MSGFREPPGLSVLAESGSIKGPSIATEDPGTPPSPRAARRDRVAPAAREDWTRRLRHAPAFLLLPLAAFALAPLVRGPMFASADGLLHLYRLVEFDQAILGGVWYPRWAPDLLAGYGYPIFIFYAPLLYYLAEAFHLAGLGFVDALKAAVAAGMVGSVGGMYVFCRDLWGRWGGFLAAAAYLYAPYRLVNTYLDGELAQTLAWAWLPWLAWACWRYLRTTRMRYAAFATVCYGGLIATHSVSGWLASLFLGLALLAMLATRAVPVLRMLKLGGFLVSGAALAAPYWLPALAEQVNVQLDRVRIATYDFHTNLLPLDRTLSLAWAHPYASYVGANGPAQLGLAQSLTALAAVLALTAAARRRWPILALFGCLAAVAFVLMLQPAAVVWDHVPFGRFLQFPDRLLAILAFCLAVLTGGLGQVLGRLPKVAAAAGAILFAGGLIFGATARLDVGYIALPASLGPGQVTEYEQISGAFGTTAKGEFTPKWLGDPPLTSPLIESELAGGLPAPIVMGDAQVRLTSRRAEALDATVTAVHAGPVALPVAYYPGWSARVNGQPAPVQPSAKGLVEVHAPAGQSSVALRLGTSPDRRLADGIGLTAALCLLALALGRWMWARPLTLPRLSLLQPGAAAAASAGILVLGLWLTPDKLPLQRWPVQRTELVGYGGWIQFMGADVAIEGDRAHVTTAFRTGAAQSARPFTATIQMLSRETVWASGSEVVPKEGWTTGVPRKVDIDVPIPPGTPPGVYLLVLEVDLDGGRTGQDWTKLTYGTPRVGTVTLGPLTLTQPLAGSPQAEPPTHSDFGTMQLVAWQPPRGPQQGQFVPFNLWWRAASVPDGDWGISLHIVDAQGQVWAGHDDQPRLGYNPTSSWRPGQLERDVQMAKLPAGMPPGEYSIHGGWYDLATRAPVGPQNVPIGEMSVSAAAGPDDRLLDIPHRLAHTYSGGLELLGYDLPTSQVTAGQALPLRLFWRATQQPAADYTLALTFAGHSEPVSLPATSQWQPGQLMEIRTALQTAPGWDGSGTLGVAIQGSPDTFDLPDTIRINPLPRLTQVPASASHVQPDTLGDAATLAGYREDINAGKLRLTLYWQRRAPLPPNLHVFVHLLNGENQVVAQHDGVPGSGQRPTGTWAADEFIEDAHEVEVPATSGPLQLEVGLYDPATGKRLGDRLLLPFRAGA